MTAIFSSFLLALLLVTAIAIVRISNLFAVVMLSGVFSLLLAINFFLLDAADVALTEAAVGAGISTVLLLSALAMTAEHEHNPPCNRGIALVVTISITLLIVYATFDRPEFGDPMAPIHQHVAPWYLESTRTAIDIPNVVTAVLGSYRGYDTLGEVFVVLTAGIGVMFLLSAPSTRRRAAAMIPDEGLRHFQIPRIVGRMVIPFILLFALYVQFHGEYSPGGGFQAGAIFAAAIILYALLEGEEQALKVLPRKLLTFLMSAGALLYGGVGVVTMLLGGNFLDYSVLASDPVKGQQWGIIAIELGVGITVAGVLLAIYHAFAARGR